MGTNLQTTAPLVTEVVVFLLLVVEMVGEHLPQHLLEPCPQLPAPLPSPPLQGPFSSSWVSGSAASVSLLHYSCPHTLGVVQQPRCGSLPCTAARSSLIQRTVHRLFTIFTQHMPLLVCFFLPTCLLHFLTPPQASLLSPYIFIFSTPYLQF